MPASRFKEKRILSGSDIVGVSVSTYHLWVFLRKLSTLHDPTFRILIRKFY